MTILANAFRCDPSFGVYYEASKLFIMIFEYVYKTTEKRQGFIREMLEWMEDEEQAANKEVLSILKQILLQQFTMKVDEPAMTYSKARKWILSIPNMNKLIVDSVQHTLAAFETEMENFCSLRTVEVTVSDM